jgi:hypothetical protein
MSVFLVAPWADSLTLACIVWAFYLLRQRRWDWAGALVFAGTLAHVTTLALVPALLWTRRKGYRPWTYDRGRRQWMPGHTWPAWASAVVVASAAAVGALAVFAVVCWRSVGSPLAFLRAQGTYFDHHLTWPWQTASLLLQSIGRVAPSGPARTIGGVQLTVDVASLVAATVLTLIATRRRLLPTPLLLYQWALLVLCVAAPITTAGNLDPIVSTGRYLLASVPLWLLIGAWASDHPRAGAALLAACAVVQVFLVGYYFTGGWLV